MQGYGLYALAFAAAVPPVLSGAAAVDYAARDRARSVARMAATELRRHAADVHRGRRARGSVVGLAADRRERQPRARRRSGRPAQVAALACTSKLAQAIVQLSWIPCDNGLIGLAQLSAEKPGSSACATRWS